MRNKKEKNTILIGESFTEKKGIKNNYFIEFKTLDECYGRASDTKQYIYKKYYNLLLENSDEVLQYGVRSYNSMIITLHAIIKKDNKLLYIFITPSYNWYEEIEKEF